MVRAMAAWDEVRELKTVATAMLVFGVITLAVGVFLVADPEETLKVFTVIFGIFLLIDGILAIAAALLGRVESRALLSVVGIVSAIAGLILIKKPFQSLTVLIVILGIWLVVAGGARIVYAFTVPEGRGVYLLVAAIDLDRRHRDPELATPEPEDARGDRGDRVHRARLDLHLGRLAPARDRQGRSRRHRTRKLSETGRGSTGRLRS